ncbi:MAG: DinB family protein [Bacteroidota bacterium]
MQLRDHFLRTYDFNTQANQRIVDALRAVDQPIDEALGLLGHMLHAEKLWFLRLEGFDTGTLTAWPSLTLNECAELAAITGDSAHSFIKRLDDQSIEVRVQYSNSKGDVYTNTIADILNHLSHHGAYHRAQINRIIREHGAEPAKVDFISFARG